MGGYRAKKRLGQNFLKSETVIGNIIELVQPVAGERIVEVGPGRGALTLPLVESGADITAVEFDRDLMGYLKKLFKGRNNVELVNADFIGYQPAFAPYKLVGNLPFNIATPVFDWTVAHRSEITKACFMVQKEVAHRVASSPGSKDWSPLAIFTQLHFDISSHFDVSPKHFSPPPKVTSTVITLTPKPSTEIAHYEAFERLVRESFGQRRKTLLNNIVPGLIGDKQTALELFAEVEIGDRCRAEAVSTEKFLKLTNLLVTRNILSV